MTCTSIEMKPLAPRTIYDDLPYVADWSDWLAKNAAGEKIVTATVDCLVGDTVPSTAIVDPTGTLVGFRLSGGSRANPIHKIKIYIETNAVPPNKIAAIAPIIITG